MNENISKHQDISMPDYNDNILADRGRSAIKDFNRVSFVLYPKPRSGAMVERFLAAFIYRNASINGVEREIFDLDSSSVKFRDWRSGEIRYARYDSLNIHQKVSALNIFCDAVPAPVRSGKRKKQ